ncbi:hypothetical protein SAMN05216431_10216 [Ligilactobacillus sp. WC1T17]|uniref:Uncharacterized protein n=1 Tax=Ligilactobacillus ruminis TaxID=1623 RepID=A0ABY1A9E6_9LACO|nr:hypothetical protein SAMN05216431_10216 [Ligilactobacillus ruminis]
MLKLDEKKVRKGKPIGLPYIGSKKKVSKKIVEIIKQNFGCDKPVYDIFGGGGATDGMTGDEVFELVAEGLKSLKQRYEVDSKTMLVYLESVIDDG